MPGISRKVEISTSHRRIASSFPRKKQGNAGGDQRKWLSRSVSVFRADALGEIARPIAWCRDVAAGHKSTVKSGEWSAGSSTLDFFDRRAYIITSGLVCAWCSPMTRDERDLQYLDGRD